MKLQRNNKYARRITAGLGALVVSLGILTGCNNSSVFPSKDTIVIETINSNDHLKESLNDPDYFSNYFNISEDELQNRLNGIDIKNSNETISLDKVGTLVIKNNKEEYKIIQTGEYYDLGTDKIYLYDLFSREVLCSINASDMNYNVGNFDETFGKYVNINISGGFNILNEKLNNYKISEYGTVQYASNFIAAHFDELIDKYATKDTYYTWDISNQNEYLLKGEYDKYFSDINRTIYELAKNYAKNVPIEFQVKSSEFEMGNTIDSLIEELNKTKQTSLKESLKDVDYFSNYFNISNEELQKRIYNIDIKNPEKVITLNKVGTLVLKGINGDYKIIQTGEYSDLENSKLVLYDLFTEEIICSINTSDMDYSIGDFDVSHGKYENIDTNKFIDISSNLDGYEIVEYGTVQYAIEFIVKHFNELLSNYAPLDAYYTVDTVDQNNYLVKDEMGKYYEEISRTIYELAENYVRNIPYEFQISSKDLNLSSNKLEYKYNVYSISEEEKQKRLSKLEIIASKEVIDVSEVLTLVLENSNSEPKILLAYAQSQDGINFKLYDLFTNEFLCDFNVGNKDNIQFSKNDRLIGYDESYCSNKSELLDNYYIKQIGLYDYSLSYVVENIDYFRNRDGIDYKIMSDAYFNVFPNGKKGVSMSIEEYAEAYVTYTPEELQISSKNLKISNDKTLIKK